MLAVIELLEEETLAFPQIRYFLAGGRRLFVLHPAGTRAFCFGAIGRIVTILLIGGLGDQYDAVLQVAISLFDSRAQELR